jgi:hypothetical protein
MNPAAPSLPAGRAVIIQRGLIARGPGLPR